MEERILKKAALAACAAAVIACVIVPFLPRIIRSAQAWMQAVEYERTKEEREKRALSGVALLEYNNKRAEEEWQNDTRLEEGIRLALPLGVSGDDIKVFNDYLVQEVIISIPFAGDAYLYDYPMLGLSGPMEDIVFESRGKFGTLTLKTDMVYELDTSYDEDYFYIRFLTPHEVYDKVVVIDAGHGGEDQGVSKQGIHEKDIDLDIALKLKEIFDGAPDTSVGVYYTRTKDKGASLDTRKKLAEKAKADLFISIHNNATQSGMMSSIHGTQAVYDTQAPESKELAQACLDELTAILGSSDKGTRAARQGEEVVYGCSMPAVQVEVGFLTNQAELEQLCSQEYQKKAAQGIYNVISSVLKKR